MAKLNPTPEQIAAIFGCTPEQVKNQFRANASQLAKDADKSFRTGRKVRGASYAQLKELQAMCESKYS